MPDRYETDYEIGQDNLQRWGMDIHHPVFWISATLILVFVIGTLISPEPAKALFDGAKSWSINYFDWLFMVAGNIFVLFCLVLIFMPFGKVRIGGAAVDRPSCSSNRFSPPSATTSTPSASAKTGFSSRKPAHST